MSDTVTILGLDKAAVLAALYNGSETGGMGLLHYDPTPMSGAGARALLAESLDREHRPGYFDYLKGRVMKVDLSGNEGFDPWGYDRDNGEGAAAMVVDALRETGDVNAPPIAALHTGSMPAALEATREMMGTSTEIKPGKGKGFTTVSMGMADVRDRIEPIVERLENDAHTEEDEQNEHSTDEDGPAGD